MKLIKAIKDTGVLTTEQKILLAARVEFGEKGLDGARMQSIADRAGTNKALLHYYFRSKNKLFEMTIKNIFENLWTDIDRQLNAHMTETDLRSLIDAIVSVYITTFAAHPELPRVIVREISLNSPALQRVVHDILSSFSLFPKTVLAIYNKELSRGAIKRIEVYHFMMNLMGMCAVTFVVQPMAEVISKKIGSTMIFDRKFYTQRIKAITEMACDGIFIKNKKEGEQ